MTRTRFDAETVADAVTLAPFSDVLARGDRWRRRRRARAAALAVVAVALAGVAVSPWTARRDGAPPPAALPGRPAAADGVFTETVLAGDRTVVVVRRNACAAVFSVSTDSGTSWTAYRGPVEWRECGIPVATDFEILSPAVYAVTIDGVRYLSRDAAATWQPTGTEFTVLDALPGRAVLHGKGTVRGVDPVTGAAYQVRRTGAVVRVADARFAPDGALWLVGDSSGNGNGPMRVVVSTDRGRSWTAAGTLAAVGADPLVVPVSAQRAYVLGVDDGRGTVHRTDDGGRTWTSTTAGWRVLTAATVTGAGRLMAYGSTSTGERLVWTGADDGRTFTAVPVTDPGVTTAGHLAGALWMAAPDGAVAVTHDGQTWQRTAARP